jgi:hypothetical protein
MKPLASLLLMSIAGVVSNANAQVAPGAGQWGEPVEGVQLQLALATTGPPTLPGELPALEVQVRNRGSTAVTVNPEALVYADIEVDDVWYAQTFATYGTSAPHRPCARLTERCGPHLPERVHDVCAEYHGPNAFIRVASWAALGSPPKSDEFV